MMLNPISKFYSYPLFLNAPQKRITMVNGEISPYVGSLLFSWMEDVGMNEISMCNRAVISTYPNSGRYIVNIVWC